MPSLLRWRGKSTSDEQVVHVDGDDQTSRQSSLSTDTKGKDANLSFARRFSRQRSIPTNIFARRKASTISSTSEQSDCSFLTMLPYEIREMIYVHLVDSETWTVDLRQVSEDPRLRKKQEKRKARGDVVNRSTEFYCLLKMLRTCRFIHDETQALLFEKMHVKCPSLLTFDAYIASVPEHRWKEIRHLSLEVTFPYLLFHEREGGPTEDQQDPSKMRYYNSEMWIGACEAIRHMASLKTLRITMLAKDYRNMHSHWPDRPSDKLWTTITRPLMRMPCDDFEIEVSWPINDHWEEAGRPFHLRSWADLDEPVESPASFVNGQEVVE